MSRLATVVLCLVALCALPVIQGCCVSEKSPKHFGVAGPGIAPELFTPGFLPSPATVVHSSPAFSPDGSEVFFSAYLSTEDERLDRVFVSQLDGERWTPAVVAPFSGEFDDNWPWFSPDGNRLYFSSKRPSARGGDSPRDYGLWRVDRRGDAWGEPSQIISAADFGHDQGVIHVAANLPGGHGDLDLYRLEFDGATYGMPQNLGPAINTASEEYGPCAARDGSFLVFTRFDEAREPKAGLYVSFRMPDGTWSEARDMGSVCAALKGGRFPGLSPDERCLFYVGDHGALYWVDAAIIQQCRPAR